MRLDPPQRRLHISQLSTQISLRRRTIIQRKHRKPTIGQMHVEITVQLLISIREPATMNIDIRRQRLTATQHRIMRQIHIQQMTAALPRSLVIPAIRQIRNIRKRINALRRMPQRGTRRIAQNRTIPHRLHPSGTLRGNASQIAIRLRPRLRITQHLLRNIRDCGARVRFIRFVRFVGFRVFGLILIAHRRPLILTALYGLFAVYRPSVGTCGNMREPAGTCGNLRGRGVSDTCERPISRSPAVVQLGAENAKAQRR